MTKFTPTQLDDLGRRATAILEAERDRCRNGTAGDPGRAIRLEQLLVDYGRPGLRHVIRTILDLVIDATPGIDAARGKQIQVLYADHEHGQFYAADDTSSLDRYAGALITARIAEDHYRVHELLELLPAGERLPVACSLLVHVLARLRNSYDQAAAVPVGVVNVVEVTRDAPG